jgi:hypothetical protein
MLLILKSRIVEEQRYVYSQEMVLRNSRAPTIEALTQAVMTLQNVHEPIELSKFLHHEFLWIPFK